MGYTIDYNDNAVKQLKKLDKSQRDIILKWINKNLNNSDKPKEKGKKLKGNLKDYWRFRVGKYRIITEIDDSLISILVINIGHRSDVYKTK